MIEIKNITKSYNEKHALSELSAKLPDKGLVLIAGPSGSGKTTLLKILMGFEKPDCGEIIMEKDVSFSVVFQEDRLLEERSALKNVTFVMEPEDPEKAAAVLSDMGLSEDVDKAVKNLSGGMARRVAIARALAVKADVYLMDEPLKGLDAENRKLILEKIREYTKDSLLILISHNPEEIEDPDMVINLKKASDPKE